MGELFAYINSYYGSLLVPFGSEDFGPKLATALLILAIAVFSVFLIFALPQALRLRGALAAIRRGSDGKNSDEKRQLFQNRFDEIDETLSSNKTTSEAWQEFRKTLIFRGSGERMVILAPARPSNFFNPRNLLVQWWSASPMPRDLPLGW